MLHFAPSLFGGKIKTTCCCGCLIFLMVQTCSRRERPWLRAQVPESDISQSQYLVKLCIKSWNLSFASYKIGIKSTRHMIVRGIKWDNLYKAQEILGNSHCYYAVQTAKTQTPREMANCALSSSKCKKFNSHLYLLPFWLSSFPNWKRNEFCWKFFYSPQIHCRNGEIARICL